MSPIDNQKQMSKDEAKIKISELIEKYKRLTPLEKKSYNEANTRKNFILPMFEALGWDIHEDIVEEDPSICGRVDYAFRVNHLTQFLLEAKSMSENLDKEQWANQTVEYGWNMGVPWVVLTDFEGLKLFNSEENIGRPKERLDFKYTEYLDKFDTLWLLSKESFNQNLLDTTLSSFGIGSKRIKVNELLAADLVRWRDTLTNNLKQWNTGVDLRLLNESVQRILDRLIFIRVIEDKGIEDKFLWQTFQRWQSNGFKPYNFIELLIPLFRKFDQTYNSNLFHEHYCEKLDTEGNPFKQIIPELYRNEKQQVSYRFDAINADVLGKVYEQYLGYLQKGKKDEGKRKKQGIYYTPSYIVDYIVSNTIGKKLSEMNNLNEKQSIKILDPACGSGSFLINSFEYLDQYLRKENNQDINDKDIAAIRKYRILQENIYGVDLDEQAIEIARLNLLLQSVVPNFKLPIISKNICVGNSLIEDKKTTDKAFEYKKEFEYIFKRENPGFDVIVGNPPYIKEFVNKAAFNDLHDSPYYQGKMDLWTLFACKAIDLLRDGGYLSFIAPNNWISNAGASIFRDKILNEGEILSFIDFGDYKVFNEAGIQTMIFVFKKCKPREKYNVEYLKIENSSSTELEIINKIQQSKIKIQIEKNKLLGQNIIFSNKENNSILEKILSKANFQLEEKEVAQGIVGAPDKCFIINELKDFGLQEREYIKSFYTSAQKYNGAQTNKYIIYLSAKNFNGKSIEDFPSLHNHFKKYETLLKDSKIKYKTPTKPYYYLHRERDERFFTKGSKIIGGARVALPSFFYTENEYYGSRALNFIKTDRINLKYLVGLLNSKLAFYWLINKGKRLGDLLQIDKGPLLKVPIYKAEKEQQKDIINLVDKIISFKTEVNNISKNSDKYFELNNKITEIEKQIDKEVYKLYGLNEEEKGIIENT